MGSWAVGSPGEARQGSQACQCPQGYEANSTILVFYALMQTDTTLKSKSPFAYLTAFTNIMSGFCLKKYIADIHMGNVMPNREQTTGVQILHRHSQ